MNGRWSGICSLPADRIAAAIGVPFMKGFTSRTKSLVLNSEWDVSEEDLTSCVKTALIAKQCTALFLVKIYKMDAGQCAPFLHVICEGEFR